MCSNCTTKAPDIFFFPREDRRLLILSITTYKQSQKYYIVLFFLYIFIIIKIKTTTTIMENVCCIADCQNTESIDSNDFKNRNLRFYNFPSEIEIKKRQLWLNAIRPHM